MLHSRRKRLAELAEREASGESFWSEEFDERVRTRMFHLMTALEPGVRAISASAQKQILAEEGWRYLISGTNYPGADFLQYLAACPDDMMPTVVEAWSQALALFAKTAGSQYWGASDSFAEAINLLLREHRISYELIGGEMVAFTSRELHVEVVAPTLRLLSSDSKWQSVETAYNAALRELSAGEAANAITDAGTALQEALTTLGCDGNALGTLIKSARRKGLLGAHDGPLLDAIHKAADWISADRSVTGDAHNATPAEVDDAWLIVHVVGAFLLRLSRDKPRG